MNNYLAKPVRAQTLKALLESYLNKDEDKKEVPNLQAEAKKLVAQALNEAGTSPEKEKDVAKNEQNPVVRKETGESTEASETRDTGEKLSRPGSARSITQRWVGPNGNDETTPTSR
jgi:YesN/AraC family two-component response regulator